RAGQVCDAVLAIRLRHCARIEIIGEQVIDPGGALHTVALRPPVADLRAGIAAGFDCWQRLRHLQIAIEILLVGLQAFDLPGDRSSETALRREARAILDALDLAGEIPGMAVVLVHALERLDQRFRAAEIGTAVAFQVVARSRKRGPQLAREAERVDGDLAGKKWR